MYDADNSDISSVTPQLAKVTPLSWVDKDIWFGWMLFIPKGNATRLAHWNISTSWTFIYNLFLKSLKNYHNIILDTLGILAHRIQGYSNKQHADGNRWDWKNVWGGKQFRKYWKKTALWAGKENSGYGIRLVVAFTCAPHCLCWAEVVAIPVGWTHSVTIAVSYVWCHLCHCAGKCLRCICDRITQHHHRFLFRRCKPPRAGARALNRWWVSKAVTVWYDQTVVSIPKAKISKTQRTQDSKGFKIQNF